jgi:hypothetical protein
VRPGKRLALNQVAVKFLVHCRSRRALPTESDGDLSYSLRPKIFALVDFCALLLTIRLIRKNYENIIYFAMTCFIIVCILSIS